MQISGSSGIQNNNSGGHNFRNSRSIDEGSWNKYLKLKAITDIRKIYVRQGKKPCIFHQNQKDHTGLCQEDEESEAQKHHSKPRQ
jgi:uncharacterized protein YjcR